MQSHCVDCVLQYNGNLWHKLLAKSWVMHYSPIMVLFSSVLFPFTSCIFASSYQYISGLVLSGNFWFVLLLSSLGCNTHVHMEKYMCSYPPHSHPPPPRTHRRTHPHASWEPSCAFLDSAVHCCNILLMTYHSHQQSVTFLRFANLHQFPFPAWFCISVPTGWMSVSILSIQISPDTVCHVYSWTFLTFDDTPDIFPIK